MKRFEIKEFCGYEVAVTEEKYEDGRICVTYDLETEKFSKDFYDTHFDNTIRGKLLGELNNSIRFTLGEAFQQMILGYYAQFDKDKVRAFTPENGEAVVVYFYE